MSHEEAEPPPPEGYAGASPTDLGTEAPGSVLGQYRIDEAIGEGGFGTVYRAGQTHPVQRSVALKILELGMDTRQVVARFEAERQALALMDHPAIARTCAWPCSTRTRRASCTGTSSPRTSWSPRSTGYRCPR